MIKKTDTPRATFVPHLSCGFFCFWFLKSTIFLYYISMYSNFLQHDKTIQKLRNKNWKKQPSKNAKILNPTDSVLTQMRSPFHFGTFFAWLSWLLRGGGVTGLRGLVCILIGGGSGRGGARGWRGSTGLQRFLEVGYLTKPHRKNQQS